MKCGLVAVLLLAGLVPSVAGAQSKSTGRPNILFIMTDDHAAHAIGAYGSRVNATPNLDRLAREGALLTSVFATNSICTPSRAAILTGQYSHINGVTMFNRFDSSRMTVARLLQQAGYYTGMIGKWHLGSDPAGFDRWEILPGQGTYFDPIFYTATSERQFTGRYATDVITDLALEFIEKRPADRPFFLMMHHKAPHRPWEPMDEHARVFATQRIPEPATFWDSYANRTDALHENQQRVAADLTNRDLKLTPPSGLSAAQLAAWRVPNPNRSRSRATGRRSHSRAKPWRAGSTRSSCRTTWQPSSRWTTASAASSRFWTGRAWPGTRSSSTRATRGSSLATTDSSTSASCTRSRSACRSSCGGRRRFSPARGATRWR